MSSVQVFVQTSNNFGLITTIDGDLIKSHSDLVRDLVDQQPKATTYQVTLTGGAPAAVKHILDHVASTPKTGRLYFNVHRMPINQAIAVHEAAILLRLQPEQPQLEAHIIGYISHNVRSPATMIAIHKVYKDGSCRIWKTMIHNMAYNFVGEKVPDAEINALQLAARPYQDLSQAIDTKIDQLKSQADHADFVRRKRAEKEARRGERAEGRKYVKW